MHRFVFCPRCGIPHDSPADCPSAPQELAPPPSSVAFRSDETEPLPDRFSDLTADDSVITTGGRGRRPLIGRLVGNKYKVQGLIGEGAMGAVYEAEHLALGRLVAVKVLHPKHARDTEAVSRLEHEARVVGAIGHPNICEVVDLGRLEDDTPYLVMERLHGETLAQRIQRGGRLLVGDIIDIAVQVLSALIVAHGKSIIHRDLKPENIFLSDRPGMPPLAKLLDFGISKASGLEDASFELTRTGMVMGTPYYMAPEQARGERTLDHRVDLWALGVVLYEGLTSRRPFLARNYNALLMQILTSQHRPVNEVVPTLPPQVAAVVNKALAKVREDRYQTALEFQVVLTDLRRQLGEAGLGAVAAAAALKGEVSAGREHFDGSSFSTIDESETIVDAPPSFEDGGTVDPDEAPKK